MHPLALNNTSLRFRLYNRNNMKMDKLSDVLLPCLILLFLTDFCSPSHFRGASFTFKPTNNGTELQIDFRISWRRGDTFCDNTTISSKTLIGHGSMSCFHGCRDTPGSLEFFCTDYSVTDDWTSGRNTVLYDPRTSGIIRFRFSGSAWISLIQGGGSWSLMVTANLENRSDTGTINSSPTFDMTPVLNLQYGCRHTINIPVTDSDGDIVRCRFATQSTLGADECGGICGTVGNLDQDNCSITFLANGQTGYYAVALQVEDFKDPSSTIPLSSVPLQFLLHIVKKPCGNAPKFISPTPDERSTIDLYVGNRTVINLEALSTENRFGSIETTSPVGLKRVSETISSNGSLHYISAQYEWTPGLSDDGLKTFCFTAKDETEQSSMQRCVFLNVIDINECESNPCLNNGTCLNLVHHFRCKCPPRFYGVQCETGICQPQVSDIIFVLDSSISMTESEFKQQLDFLTSFVESIAIGPEDLQIAVITFSTHARIEFKLDDYANGTKLIEAIRGISYRPGTTRTDKGLEKVKEVLSYVRGPRPYGKYPSKYVFLLTDGMSVDKWATRRMAKQIQDMVDKLVAIGIGHQVSHQELLDIASSGDDNTPGYVFSVDNFNALHSIIKQLVHYTCEECSTSSLSDILFLLDDSSYISSEDFQVSINSVSYIVQNMSHFGSETGQKVGIAVFGQSFGSILNLNNGETKQGIQASINRLTHSIGFCSPENCGINVTDAINKSLSLFREDYGGRGDSRKFLIVLSNGKFGYDVGKVGELLTNWITNINVTMFVVGVGDSANLDDLISLTFDPNYLYFVPYGGEPTSLDVLQAEFQYSYCTNEDDKTH